MYCQNDMSGWETLNGAFCWEQFFSTRWGDEGERKEQRVSERETREITSPLPLTLCYRLSLLREKVDFFLIFFAYLIEFLDFYEFFLVGCFAFGVGSWRFWVCGHKWRKRRTLFGAYKSLSGWFPSSSRSSIIFFILII